MRTPSLGKSEAAVEGNKTKQKHKKTVDEIVVGELSRKKITFIGSDTVIPKGELRLFIISGELYSLFNDGRANNAEESANGLHIELKAYTSLAELVREMNLKSDKRKDYIMNSIQEFPIRKGDIYSTEYRDSWE